MQQNLNDLKEEEEKKQQNIAKHGNNNMYCDF